MQTETLDQLIKSKLSAAHYEKLPELLGITQHKLTRILNRPKEATLDEVLNLASLLSIKVANLIHEYGMGRDNISLSDCDMLIDKVA